MSEVSEQANEWVQRSVRAKQAVRSNQMSEQCEWMSSIYVSIIGYSEPQCIIPSVLLYFFGIVAYRDACAWLMAISLVQDHTSTSTNGLGRHKLAMLECETGHHLRGWPFFSPSRNGFREGSKLPYNYHHWSPSPTHRFDLILISVILPPPTPQKPQQKASSSKACVMLVHYGPK